MWADVCETSDWPIAVPIISHVGPMALLLYPQVLIPNRFAPASYSSESKKCRPISSLALFILAIPCSSIQVSGVFQACVQFIESLGWPKGDLTSISGQSHPNLGTKPVGPICLCPSRLTRGQVGILRDSRLSAN